MESTISVEAKKEFIRWFLKRHKLKRRECVWILHHLMSIDEALENVVFTENARSYPRGMAMSTMNSIDLPFLFYTPSRMTSDANLAYVDVQLNWNEKLYIQLNYPDSHVCEWYAKVLEDETSTDDDVISESVKRDADQLLNEMETRLVESEYERLINKALDERDSEAFKHWTGEFEKMREEVK